MSKVSKSKSLYKQQTAYTVIYTYVTAEGFHREVTEEFYCDTNLAAKDVEQYAFKSLKKGLKNFSIIEVRTSVKGA